MRAAIHSDSYVLETLPTKKLTPLGGAG